MSNTTTMSHKEKNKAIQSLKWSKSAIRNGDLTEVLLNIEKWIKYYNEKKKDDLFFWYMNSLYARYKFSFITLISHKFIMGLWINDVLQEIKILSKSLNLSENEDQDMIYSFDFLQNWAEYRTWPDFKKQRYISALFSHILNTFNTFEWFIRSYSIETHGWENDISKCIKYLKEQKLRDKMNSKNKKRLESNSKFIPFLRILSKTINSKEEYSRNRDEDLYFIKTISALRNTIHNNSTYTWDEKKISIGSFQLHLKDWEKPMMSNWWEKITIIEMILMGTLITQEIGKIYEEIVLK